MEAPKKMNFYPAKNGISPYYSPRMILHHQQLDYEKHCKYAAGTYVQASNDQAIKNTNAPRTLDCLYLRYAGNHQGGHELLHLATNAVITRPKVTQIPITPAVIKRVHEIAERDGMPTGLKVQDRYGTILYDSAWIAGVDYNEELFDDDDYDEYYDEDGNRIDDTNDNNEDEEQEPEPIDELANEINNNDDNIDEVMEIDEGDEDNPTTVEDNDDNKEVEPEEETVEPEQEPEPEPRRSGRTAREPERLITTMFHHENYAHLEATTENTEEYTLDSAKVLAKVMCHYQSKFNDEAQFAQTYTLKQGQRQFRKRTDDAAMKEMGQLHERKVFEPINVSTMDATERKKAMESLIFVTEKRDGVIKARMCANGSTQREYIEREHAVSPTTITESVILTGVIDAKQNRDVMVSDVPNSFVQTDIDLNEERVIMKIRGILVDILVEMDPDTYAEHVCYDKNGNKLLYVRMLKALYGMIVAALLYYKKFVKDIKKIGFKLNLYDVRIYGAPTVLRYLLPVLLLCCDIHYR